MELVPAFGDLPRAECACGECVDGEDPRDCLRLFLAESDTLPAPEAVEVECVPSSPLTLAASLSCRASAVGEIRIGGGAGILSSGSQGSL
mmetsp:Transcript_1021/g.2851  ORF Transcript_1021/g.2851 Transcript_1021/m.2851 type:complete len:90 (+) Transcript_1021:137-406(+)